MLLLSALSLVLSVALGHPSSVRSDAELGDGPWRAWLDCPGGPVPFGLVLESASDGSLAATVVNGSEEIPIPIAHWDGNELRLEFDHYASRIDARLTYAGQGGTGGMLSGQWTKRLGADRWTRMAFHAIHGSTTRFSPIDVQDTGVDLSGRWAVDFESDDLPAVAEFEQAQDGTLTGTFLTATGDYRYLAGDVAGNLLRLSVFDGAHAFLFHATPDETGVLQGEFWSRDSWHETWTAVRDADASMPDAFQQTTWDERASLADFLVPDLTGRIRSLAEPELAGTAVILQLFGSWCPNCHDEGAYLAELDRRYRDRGLSILGLAFELTGDFERDAEQVRRYAERHGCEYPFFVVGSAQSKAVASQAFPAIDRLRSYPTTVFLHGDGRVRAVHSGFSGPATGAEHAKLRAEFEGLIEELLNEELDSESTWEFLRASRWKAVLDIEPLQPLTLRETSSRERRASFGQADLAVAIRGDAVRLGEHVFRLDREAKVLLSPGDYGRRYARSSDPEWPLLVEQGIGPRDHAAYARAAREHANPIVRREAITALAWIQRADPEAFEGVDVAGALAAALKDPDSRVRTAGCWAAGMVADEDDLELLADNLEHPAAAVRREAVRALLRFPGAAENPALASMRNDIDPLVREAVAPLFD